MTLQDAHALVIGISDYSHIQRLPVVHDAQDVAELLSDPARCGYRSVTTLLDQGATRLAILDALDTLAQTTQTSSTVFIYFSGHGGSAMCDGRRVCYLMPVDSIWGAPADLEATAIAGDALSERLRKIPASRVTVVLDCCRAAGIAEPKDMTKPHLLEDLSRTTLDPLAGGRGRAIFAASVADGQAFVRPGERNGIFTRYLLDGLRGAATAAGGVIRVCDLFHYVQQAIVANYPAQRPVFRAELEENYPVANTIDVPAAAASEPQDGFAFDAFVSYVRADKEDRAWVEKVLVPLLTREGIKLILERDFRPGLVRIREMERAVNASRYTLAVFSPSYVADGFTDFQALLSQHLGLETREPRLIPVLRRPCKLELGARMTSLLDLTEDDDVIAGVQRLAVALRERPHARLDTTAG